MQILQLLVEPDTDFGISIFDGQVFLVLQDTVTGLPSFNRPRFYSSTSPDNSRNCRIIIGGDRRYRIRLPSLAELPAPISRTFKYRQRREGQLSASTVKEGRTSGMQNPTQG